jgi:hypothetical protein
MPRVAPLPRHTRAHQSPFRVMRYASGELRWRLRPLTRDSRALTRDFRPPTLAGRRFESRTAFLIRRVAPRTSASHQPASGCGEHQPGARLLSFRTGHSRWVSSRLASPWRVLASSLSRLTSATRSLIFAYRGLTCKMPDSMSSAGTR